MAIQVGGTTVIDNSRNLQNVGGLKTVGGTSILGSGNIEAGASTTAGAVGTYCVAVLRTTSSFSAGSTFAGSIFRRQTYTPFGAQTVFYGNMVSMTRSGTWQTMTDGTGLVSGGNSFGTVALLQRIA